MIMARRMTLEGAEVVMVVELMDYLPSLTVTEYSVLTILVFRLSLHILSQKSRAMNA